MTASVWWRVAITVARNRYIKAVQEYNVTIRSFPSNLTAMIFSYKEKPNFSVANEKDCLLYTSPSPRDS